MPPTKRKHARSDDESEATRGEQESEPEDRKKVRWDEGHSAEEDTDVAESAYTAKICLTAICQNGQFACAYYDPQKCTIYALEDTQGSAPHDAMRLLFEQSGASVVLTSSNSDDEFIDILQECAENSGAFFQIRPRREFLPEKGRNRLLSLRLLAPHGQADASMEGELQVDPLPRERDAYDFIRRQHEVVGNPAQTRWHATIRLSNFASVESSPLCIASIGALIDCLVRERALSDLDGGAIADLDVDDIEIISPKETMQINADALFSLQVFENESHASMHSSKTKEGLSVFGILNNTKTVLGRSLMSRWLLQPSLSLPVIKARHDAVECFMRPENQVPASSMESHLKGIKNMPRILNTMKSGRAKLPDWQHLMKFTFHTTMLWDTLHDLCNTANVPIIRELAVALDMARSKEVGAQVNAIIDWEESVTAGRVCVRHGIDEELDDKKHIYYGIDSVLSKVAERICYSMDYPYTTSLNVVYFPQLGFLICVPMLEEWQAEGVPDFDDWTFQFSSDAHAYFKSHEMRDLDVHIGDLHSIIVDREIEIVQELLNEILQFSEVINRACSVCAELDCLLSFSAASRANNYVRPMMVDDNVIDIKQGRHPLQEQVVDTFVANDFYIVGGIGSAKIEDNTSDREHKSVMLLTGANACGKSVYLKQIALIQFMSQVGCFVPAESATLGIVDKIFTRISTRESVSKLQSAFMIDLNQVSYALRNCTARSLILLDEFGKGTLATGAIDGAGLFCGVLRHFLGRGIDCPKVLAATHFHDVFQAELFDPNVLPIALRHMQIIFESSTRLLGESSGLRTSDHLQTGSGEEVTYLYREFINLKPKSRVAVGLSLESHAAKCAERFGIPSRIVQRAQYVSQLISAHELEKLLDEDMTEDEKVELEDAEAVCRRFLAWDLEDKEGLRECDVKAKLAEVLGRTGID